MRILLTNDDGIGSPIFPQFIDFLKKFGEVTVAAPAEEQSGKSQAIDFRNPIEVKKVSVFGDTEAYAVGSTPADCVRFGVIALKREYDLVVSGINRGYNLGADIAYSGTVGAILEAAHLGIKGIAVSTDPDAFSAMIKNLDAVAEFIEKNRIFDINGLYNVNIPPKVEGFAFTKPGGTFYSDGFESLGNGRYIQTGYPVETKYATDTDIGAVRAGLVSISPLTSSKLHLSAFDALKNKIK